MRTIKLVLQDLLEFYNGLLDETDKKKNLTQQKFLIKILPGADSSAGDFYSILCRREGKEILSRSTASRFLNGGSEAKKIYIDMGKLIAKNLPMGNMPIYEECEVRKEISRNWGILLQGLKVSEGELNSRIIQLVKRLPENQQELCHPRERLLSIMESAFPYKQEDTLASLTLISISHYYWSWEEKDNIEFEETDSIRSELEEKKSVFESIWRMILPRDSKTSWEEDQRKPRWNQTGQISRCLAEAEKCLKDIEENISLDEEEKKRRVKKCCEKCREILTWDVISVKEQGRAAYFIYKFAIVGLYDLPSGESAEQYLELSYNCGNDEGLKEWSQNQSFSLLYKRKISADTSSGLCIFNEENPFSRIVSETMPENWKAVTETSSVWNETILTSSKNGQFVLKPGQRQRYMLLSEDTQRNLQNALAVLQTIKMMNQAGKKTIDKDSWQIEIYLYAKEEKVVPIIDTALSHMDDCVVPVHILDDDKRTAQQLLYLHPLIYPIRNLTKETEAYLYFVVIGNTNCAEWLVRQAYWLLTFSENQRNIIHPRIVFLGLNAEKEEENFLRGCSEEMFKNPFGPIKTENVKKIPKDLYGEIDRLFDEKTPENAVKSYYFAVDVGEDEENLNQAISLREELTREKICTKRFTDRMEMSEMPVITFRCKNENIALLSRTMVVQMENYGNRWFNNYSLIPFGVQDTLYSWNQINGGTLEEMARCIHLQYWGVDTKEKALRDGNGKYSEKYLKERKEAMKSYYLRHYNRASSLAVAMSLPYRLYQCEYHGSRITPSLIWNISDAATFENEEVLERLAKKFSSCRNLADKISPLAEWEHSRWVRYMESLGWVPVTAKQTIAYIKAGNPWQQLYIARMHPCMCSYQRLGKLQEELNEAFKNDNRTFDFFDNDRKNVYMTSEILRRSWFHTEEK